MRPSKCIFCGHFFVSLASNRFCSSHCEESNAEYENSRPKAVLEVIQTARVQAHDSFEELISEVYRQERLWKERYW